MAEKRPNHQFWLHLIFGIANLIFLYLNYQERVVMQQEAAIMRQDASAIKEEAKMTREMLNARAQIFQFILTAISEHRKFTDEETTQIERLWTAAEFDIEKRPHVK